LAFKERTLKMDIKRPVSKGGLDRVSLGYLRHRPLRRGFGLTRSSKSRFSSCSSAPSPVRIPREHQSKRKRRPGSLSACEFRLVPKGGLEPPRVSPPPPQDGVSTMFHHFGTRGKNIVSTAARKIKRGATARQDPGLYSLSSPASVPGRAPFSPYFPRIRSNASLSFSVRAGSRNPRERREGPPGCGRWPKRGI
jgi:hypothetical protein